MKNPPAKSKSNPSTTRAAAKRRAPGAFRLDEKTLVSLHEGMLRSRLLEERIIKMYKQGHGFFWIGGPGEESFNYPLGTFVKKGEGKDYDFLHLHYRSSAIVMAMGIDPKDAMRQMKNTATDPYSGGRNFSNHYAIKKWNVCPVASTIETQYAIAIGTGIAQAKHGGDGVTIVNGGDAGTAEGEFASCMVWASRPALPLPLLMVVTNNTFGISTCYDGQHGERAISDRAKAFGIEARTINGNDVEESYFALKDAFDYIRTERKPYFIEAHVSRLYGHSSATGATYVQGESDSLIQFEKELIQAGVLKEKDTKEMHERITAEYQKMANEVIQEPQPDGSTIYDHVYYGQKGRYW